MTAYGNRKNGTQHVYSQLKDLVINYHIPPGRHLHPNDFMDPMKVSSTPIRDAMHRLSGEQLLVFVPNKGFFSKILDLIEMKELLVLEFLLLQHAVGTHMEFGHPIEQRAESLFDAVQPADFCMRIEDVFERIAYSSGNTSLTSHFRNLLDRTHYISLLEFEDPSRRENTATQLDDLLESLISRNIGTAERILREQLRERLHRVPSIVKEGLARSHQSERCAALSRGRPPTIQVNRL